jgi:cytidine deaminase
MKKVEYLLNKAAVLAGDAKNDKKRWLLACVAERSDGAIVSSVNHEAPDRHLEAHAEARVLKKVDRGAVLYISRVLRGDRRNWAMARPCPNCQRLIKKYGVKKVYYTIANGEYGIWNPQEE